MNLIGLMLMGFTLVCLCPCGVSAKILYQWVDRNGEIHVSDQRPDQAEKVKEFASYSFPNGSKYVGEAKDGTPLGQRILSHLDGTRYEGEFKNGKAHGKGTATFSDKLEYSGEWQHGKPHGKGRSTFPSGKTYEGEWREGVSHGPGEITDTDGSRYQADFQNEQALERSYLADYPIDSSYGGVKTEACYEAGYDYGMGRAKATYHLSAGTEQEMDISDLCKGKEATRRGIEAGDRAVRWMVGD